MSRGKKKIKIHGSSNLKTALRRTKATRGNRFNGNTEAQTETVRRETLMGTNGGETPKERQKQTSPEHGPKRARKQPPRRQTNPAARN